MVFLILAVTASLSIGAVFKHAGETGLDSLRLLVVNYLTASGMAIAMLAIRGTVWSEIWSPSFAAFSLVAGVILIAGFFVFARSTALAGMAMSIAVMRIGVALPFLASWLFWGENPSQFQWMGLVLVGVALVLVTRPRKARAEASSGAEPVASDVEPDGPASADPDLGDDVRAPASRSLVSVALMLILVFFAGGFGDLIFKSFHVWFGETIGDDAFIGVAFGVSFLVGAAVQVTKPRGQRLPSSREIAWGVALGVANYASVLFILAAVSIMPATVVFPTHGVSVVVGGTLLGTLFWTERLSRTNLAGISLAAVAVLLLNL